MSIRFDPGLDRLLRTAKITGAQQMTKPTVTQARDYARKIGYKKLSTGIYLKKTYICKDWQEFIKLHGRVIREWVEAKK